MSSPNAAQVGVNVGNPAPDLPTLDNTRPSVAYRRTLVLATSKLAKVGIALVAIT